MSRRTRSSAALLGACALAAALTAHAEPPDRPTQPVPDPGKGLASGDDASAIAVNPANLAFLPDPELRWTWVWPSSGSPLPARGHSLSLGIPLWSLATGLRLDFLDPSSAAPEPFDDSWRWVRWDVAARAGDTVALGTTLGWGSSDALALDGHFSLTTGLTVRPSPIISLAAVARDWNQPENRLGQAVERSYALGMALRPALGSRGFEVGVEGELFEDSGAWIPRATIGIDVPRVGRVRGDVTVRGLQDESPKIAAMAGLDVNIDRLQVSGGGVFGDAFTRSGAGFYAGAALRGYREPGVRLPARVVKVRIDDTPGVRAHTRLLRKLWRLAEDPAVEGVLLVIRDEPASSTAHAEELGDAIRAVRVRGKKVICHLEDAGGRSLHVCSQADTIAMNPAGGLRFAGVSAKFYYFGALLRKLGVQADFVRIGAHKLAAEQFTSAGGSDVAQLDHQELVDQFYGALLHDVGGGRRIPRGELARRIARGPFLAREAKEAGLIDLLAFDDEIDRVVDEVMGKKSRLADDDAVEEAPERWGSAPKVALVYLDGDMIDGESKHIPFVGVRLAGSRTVAGALKKAREDRSVKAVVFRIETGGGSSLAADVILREAILTARVKPLIVSMGSSAASGGYYAAVAGHPVFANRSTVTGSIGIFYGKVDVSGLLDKLGVRVETFRSAPRADAESLFRPFTDDEREVLGVKVKQFYDLFIARVAEGRGLAPEAIDAVARGRVWTGAQAHARRLVDRVGGLREALEEARRLGRLPDDAPIVSLPDEDESLLGLLMGLAGAHAGASGAGLAAAAIPPALLDVARALTPFLVFEPDKPLARIEVAPELSFGGPAASAAEAEADAAPEP
ncbi:MAG: signal peptide peptidase SppA [Polyangiaceae bacterium]|nr:signal peptide peptidase SppA [Polyangiaceae bacterium]